jgi:hypothetical protein
VLKLMERRAKLTGLDAAEKVQEVGPVSDAKASLLAKLKKMAERMRPPEIAAPLKDVTPPVIEHEPSADANAETSMIHYRDADAPTTATPRPAVTPALVGEIASVTVTEKRASVTAKQAVVTKKADGVTKKRGHILLVAWLALILLAAIPALGRPGPDSNYNVAVSAGGGPSPVTWTATANPTVETSCSECSFSSVALGSGTRTVVVGVFDNEGQPTSAVTICGTSATKALTQVANTVSDISLWYAQVSCASTGTISVTTI